MDPGCRHGRGGLPDVAGPRYGRLLQADVGHASQRGAPGKLHREVILFEPTSNCVAISGRRFFGAWPAAFSGQIALRICASSRFAAK